MNFYPCWFWENGINEAVLQALEIEARELELKPGELAYGNINKEIRDSNSAAFASHHWFTGVMFNFAVHANKEAGWQRTIEFPEVTQIAEYGPEQHYKWHTDTDPFSVAAYARKVTVICLLNDPSEFEGGAFEIEHAKAPALKRGSVIAFPSSLRHQVAPVTSGLRRSATCWAVGPQKW